MGTFRHAITLISTDMGQRETLDAMVDTGSTYTWVPESVLLRLGIRPVETRAFILPDSSRHFRDIGRVWVELLGKEEITLVVFAPDDAVPLLGAYTLEGFGLGVDPVNKRLVPADAYALGPRVADDSS